MDLSEQITKMNLYKTFEPFIAPSVTTEDRLKGRIVLTADAPKEAADALTKWKAMKLKDRLF